ncbi:MAG: hypothetical protein SNJ77_00815 [Cytophagales bacterium]
MMTSLKTPILITLILNMFIASAQINSSEKLVTEMHKKYVGKFNKDITFIQMNTNYLENGKTELTTCYEAFHFPGKYRIDIGFTPNIDGVIHHNDSAYFFKEGKLVKKELELNDVLLLTGDIYFIEPKESLSKLRNLGYNTSIFREDVWDDKPVYVVGANKGDEKSPQFWIDKENLYLVRNINKSKETGKLEDAHYVEHEIVGNVWVENKVKIYSDGKLVRMEKYTEVEPNKGLNKDIFNPNKWGSLHWHTKKK